MTETATRAKPLDAVEPVADLVKAAQIRLAAVVMVVAAVIALGMPWFSLSRSTGIDPASLTVDSWTGWQLLTNAAPEATAAVTSAVATYVVLAALLASTVAAVSRGLLATFLAAVTAGVAGVLTGLAWLLLAGDDDLRDGGGMPATAVLLASLAILWFRSWQRRFKSLERPAR